LAECSQTKDGVHTHSWEDVGGCFVIVDVLLYGLGPYHGDTSCFVPFVNEKERRGPCFVSPSFQPFLDDHEDLVQNLFPSAVLAIFVPTILVLCVVDPLKTFSAFIRSLILTSLPPQIVVSAGYIVLAVLKG
jgi:hypothetical protein